MIPSSIEQPVVNEEIWRACVQKGQLHDEATARKFKVAAGIVLSSLAIGSILYFFASR